MTYLKINAERLKTNFDQLAEIGATVEGGVTRLALSNEDLEARAWLADQFEDAGLFVTDDDAGNLSGILRSDNPDAPTLMIGSHMDSVPNGGRYDCSVGILAALECLRTIKQAGLKLPLHLEVIDFTDEEGCWQSMFGSRALTGKLETEDINDQSVDRGPLRAALFRAGILPGEVHKARRDPGKIAGYLEIHIEQGTNLDREGIDIGIVAGVVGRSTYEVTFYGEASHSGTTRIANRRDALRGAADYVNRAYELIEQHFPIGIFNCGNIVVSPGSFNIVPDKAVLTIECRHPDSGLMNAMESTLLRLADETAVQHGLSVKKLSTMRMPTAPMSEWAMLSIEKACQQVGVSYRTLISYAGHDAQMMSSFTPTGLIFIPSVDGISHSPKEFTQWPHITKGTNVLLQTILTMARDYDL